MGEIDALNKFSEYFNEHDVSKIVKVLDGFVFYIVGASQPIYVDRKGVHGLNGNVEADRKIIDMAATTIINVRG